MNPPIYQAERLKSEEIVLGYYFPTTKSHYLFDNVDGEAKEIKIETLAISFDGGQTWQKDFNLIKYLLWDHFKINQ